MDSDNVTSGENQQETLSRLSLDPNWVCGFVDGEGCFSVPIRQNPMAPHGWQLQPTFQVSQHRSNRAVLDALESFFGCGAVRSKGPRSTVDVYNVWRPPELLELVLPVFERYPLYVKQMDCRRFAIIVRSLSLRRHMRYSSFKRLVRIAYSMNANGKQRSRPIGDVLNGSSETVRQAR